MNAARKTPPRHRPGEKTLTPKVEQLAVGDHPPAAPAEDRTPVVPDSGTHRPRAGTDELPRYQQAVRVEARLWPEQVPALAALRRQVAAGRQIKTERITDNTLLRVAVDLLLAHAGQLVGDTEDQLRSSVLPDSGATELPYPQSP